MDPSDSIQRQPRVSPPPADQAATSSTGGFKNLPHYPSDSNPDILIRSRTVPVVEISAGTLLGTLLGLAIGVYCLFNGSDVGAFLLILGPALLIGAIIGWIVGHVTGPTGELTFATVLAAVPRIIIAATIGMMFGVVFAVLGIVFVPRQRRHDEYD